jgi:2-polyprenyl-3-methyl-5-hydroxy-6-metoxy-1,4-benzoquinol methylase
MDNRARCSGAMSLQELKMILQKRNDCRVCRHDKLTPVLPLEPIPMSSPNIRVDKKTYPESLGKAPLVVYRCERCNHLQLLDLLDPKFQYSNYQYTTSISLELGGHFKALAARIGAIVGSLENKFVLEIGSNDGTLLANCAALGARVLGIDPAEKASKIAVERGVPTLNAFFSKDLAQEVRAKHGRPDVIISNYMFANIDDLDNFGSGFDELLAEDGALIIETSYGLDVIEKYLIDTIYHEHLSYFTVESLDAFFKRFGMYVAEAERIPTKGGALRAVIRRKRPSSVASPHVDAMLRAERAADLTGPAAYKAFMSKMNATSDFISAFVEKYRGQRKIGVFGSAIGSMPMMSQFKLWDKVSFVADDKPLTEQFQFGDTTIPVVKTDKLGELAPCALIILAWRYADPIIASIQKVLGPGTPLALPFPETAERSS